MGEKKIINDSELGQVSGGWQYASGSSADYGSYLVYTVAYGDVLGGLALRFGVTVAQIAQWNSIKDVNKIRVGQKLVIYAKSVR